jgi:SAM-dependent methyltransferase
MVDDSYLLSGGAAELERLRLQARVWEPAAERMLDQIPVKKGWSCADLGCGAMGILGPLSTRVGPSGKVVGLDLDDKQLVGARAYVKETNLSNVEILARDAYNTQIPDDSFDLTHARFVFAPVGRDDELIREMLRITKPGGVIAVQEPDASSWSCFPRNNSWDSLRTAIEATFSRGGGDFNAGRKTFGLLKRAGLENVQVRAAVLALQDNHPYMRLPIQFAVSLRKRILDANLMGEKDLDEHIKECERVVQDPTVFAVTFMLVQVWGSKH